MKKHIIFFNFKRHLYNGLNKYHIPGINQYYIFGFIFVFFSFHLHIQTE